MAAMTAERDLLFGLLALQIGMIDQAQLVAAFQAWTRDKARALADHLVGRGDLEAGDRSAVEALVARHLKKHGGDVEQSLAAIPAGRSTRERLAQIEDPDLGGTLGHLGPLLFPRDGDPECTATYSVGTAASDGQRFRILRPHAQGGLGAVFVALDSELHREVALKQILDQHADDPDSRQRFLIEAEITGGLEHPGIVPVYGLGSHADGRPYYAMRFIQGDSLKEAIEQFHARHVGPAVPAGAKRRTESGGAVSSVSAGTTGPTGSRELALRRLLRRFLDVCNAIDYAHSRGVLHRDLKPGNVIVGKHGETLVVDWGLAKATGKADPAAGERTLLPASASGSAETLPGSALGTPAYMSPEQASGELDRLGPRSDVYSLGATLYCLLLGRPPVEGPDIGEVLRHVQRGEFARPRQLDPSIDPALEAICLKAMATQPEDRYSSCRALAEDIERWMADEPIGAYREPLWRRARRWAKQNRTAVTSAAVALVAGVVGLATVLAVQTRAKAEVTRALANETRANVALAAANQRVEQRYALATDAIRTFHTGVSEDFLLREEQFKALRDRLLQSAAEFYGKLGALLGRDRDVASRRALYQANFELAELTAKIGANEAALAAHRQVLVRRAELAAEPGADPETQADVGRSLTKVAMLLAATGQTDEALATSLEAERLLGALATSSSSARSALANCRLQLGWLLSTIGRSSEALAMYRQARADQEGLAGEAGRDNEARRDLARAISAIGILLSQTGEPAEAEAQYKKALAIQQKLADENPAVTDFRSRLADSHLSLGLLLAQRGEPAEAEVQYKKSLAIQQKLADDHPAVTDFRICLALSHNNLGNLLFQTGQPSEAEAEHQKALAIRQKLAEAEPRNSATRRAVGMSLNNLGDLNLAAGRFDTAFAKFHQSVALHDRLARDHPNVTDYRSGLAFALTGLGRAESRAGRRADAVESLRRAVSLREAIPNLNIDARYELACDHALLAAAAADPRSGLSAAIAVVEADRAMAALRRAVAAGYGDLDQLRRDPDLGPLRDRDDFRLLMMDLAWPAEPFAPAR
jgi:serine/threonine-protein kinase